MDVVPPIKTAVLIGSGNVATHLAVGLYNKGIDILQVYSLNESHAMALAGKTKSEAITDLSALNPAADLYLLAIPDGTIASVAQQIPRVEGIVAHTSGFTSISAFKGLKHFGVFYPLQTFSKERAVQLSEVPFFLEANNQKVMEKLHQLALLLSPKVEHMDSSERKRLHLAAVFVSNFNNYLYLLAHDYLKEEGIAFEYLHALIRETAAKVTDLAPREAQTGPARRNDQKTLEAHLKLLENRDEFREFYQLFSKHILRRYYE
jgi:predicted short-subunit dehydrogenase-like oxidoreductase (DUF2520 family)